MRVRVYMIAVVGPRCPFHLAALQIKGKEFNVDVARASEDAVTQPHHLPRIRYDHIGVDHRSAVLSIGTINQNKIHPIKLNMASTHNSRIFHIDQGIQWIKKKQLW